MTDTDLTPQERRLQKRGVLPFVDAPDVTTLAHYITEADAKRLAVRRGYFLATLLLRQRIEGRHENIRDVGERAGLAPSTAQDAVSLYKIKSGRFYFTNLAALLHAAGITPDEIDPHLREELETRWPK